MLVKEEKAKYDMEYAKAKLKRIPLDVQKEKYEEMKAAADAAGEKVNTYIKKAIDERMERDGGQDENSGMTFIFYIYCNEVFF